MAKFRYRMQSILDIKQKLEDQAKNDFSMAKLRLDQQQDRLESLYGRQQEYRDEARKLRESRLDFQKLRENQKAQESMTAFIEQQKIEVDKAERNLEAARIVLQEYRMDRKMHEKLREKALAEFMLEENRRESKEVDELTSYIYGRKTIMENG